MAMPIAVSLPAWGIAALVVAVSYLAVGCIVNYNKLRQFKGPPLAAFSRFWLFWEEVNGRLVQSNQAILKEYGSPARIGPNLLVTDDIELIRHMNAPGSKWTRGPWYNAMKLDPRQDSVFSTRNEKLHADLKAKEAPSYNGRDVATHESDIDGCIAEMLDLIKTAYKDRPMDIAAVSRFFTLDVLSTIAFGKPFGFMAANEDKWHYNREAANFTLLLVLQLNHPWINWLLSTRFVQALAAPKVTDKIGWGPALAHARAAVSERYGPDAKVRKDMLGSFVEKGLDQTQAECEAFLQILAGSDSTTDVLRSTMFLLSGSPPAYAKLRAEVDAAIKAGATDGPSIIKYTEALKLPYLHACILEALRLFPPLFGMKMKNAPKGGETVNGIFFPEGTEVGIADHAFMRREDVFGGNVDVYQPERFLEGDEATLAKRVRSVDTVFGTGRYQCLGKHIATMELHKAIFELFRHFDFQVADPTKGVTIIYHGVHQASGMNLIAQPR